RLIIPLRIFRLLIIVQLSKRIDQVQSQEARLTVIIAGLVVSVISQRRTPSLIIKHIRKTYGKIRPFVKERLPDTNVSHKNGLSPTLGDRLRPAVAGKHI